MKRPVDLASRFLRMAERDLQAFYVLKESPKIALNTICFHGQQVVEKCLKAVLIFYGKDPSRTHDLNKLVYSLIEIKVDPPIPIEEVSKLNPYAVIFRYDDSEIEILTRNEAQQIIETIYNWAQKIIK